MTKLKNNKRRDWYVISIVVVLISSIISCITTYRFTIGTGYTILFILPFIYGVAYTLVLGNAVFYRPKLFLIIFTVINYIRYSILPFLISYTGYFGGRATIPPTIHQFSYAVLLMVYEIIIVSFFIYIGTRRYNINLNVLKIFNFENKNYFIYKLFALLTIVLMLFNIRVLNQFNFIKTSSQSLVVYGNYSKYSAETSVLFKFSGYLLNILKQIVLVLLIYKLGIKYQKKKNKIYFYFAMIVGLLNITIYYGANRSDLLLQSIATLIILYSIFSKEKRKIFTVVGLLSVFMVIIVSISRQHSVISSQHILLGLTDTIQIYLGGPYNVALSIDMANKYSSYRNLFTLIGDLTRSVLGVNFIAKKFVDVLSTDLFNWRIFGPTDYGTQILPMIGQGYFYFGFIFAPIFEILFVKFSFRLERLFIKTKDPVLSYFASITCLRLGFIMSQNTVIQLNDLSYNLFIPFILVFLNKRIVFRK